MSVISGWKVYDIGRLHHGRLLNDGRTRQERYFIAGINYAARHWTPDHCLTREVAQRVANWKNAWEDALLKERGR